jgi:hypothetical protein
MFVVRTNSAGKPKSAHRVQNEEVVEEVKLDDQPFMEWFRRALPEVSADQKFPPNCTFPELLTVRPPG